MPKVILLNGGPRKNGNTIRIGQWVAQGAVNAGAEVEAIHLIDHHIHYCQGCESCGHSGVCVIKDDFQRICKKLDNAQGLIVCSPVYGGFYSAILKTFYDRLSCIIGFSGRFNHLCTVAITTAKYDFRLKNAKDMASINSSWLCSGHVTGYIHKSVLDIKNNQIISITPDNSPKLHKSALEMGSKLVDDIYHERRDDTSLPLKLLYRHFVLPGIARILITHRDRAEFLYQIMKDQGIINRNLLRKYHKQNVTRKIKEHKTLEKVIFRK